MPQQRLDIVRRNWVALREGGVEAALETIASDALFVTTEGRTYRGHDGIRAFFAGLSERNARFVASPFTFEPVGDGVLVAGHGRVAGPAESMAEHLHFTYRVRDGLIVDMRAFTDRASAVAELQAPSL